MCVHMCIYIIYIIYHIHIIYNVHTCAHTHVCMSQHFGCTYLTHEGSVFRKEKGLRKAASRTLQCLRSQQLYTGQAVLGQAGYLAFR